jgi:hypothetical protein
MGSWGLGLRLIGGLLILLLLLGSKLILFVYE